MAGDEVAILVFATTFVSKKTLLLISIARYFGSDDK